MGNTSRTIGIEFIGLPGSGKTTLARMLSGKIGIPLKYDRIAQWSFCSDVSKRLRVALQAHKILGKSARLYDAWAYERLKDSVFLREKLSLLEKEIFNAYAEESPSTFEQLPLLQRSLERDFVFMWDTFQKKVSYINDDGAVQRMLSMRGLRGPAVTTPSTISLTEHFLSSVPNSCVIVSVGIHPATALQRCIGERGGVPELLQTTRQDALHMFERGAEYVTLLEEVSEKKGVRLVRLDGENNTAISLAILMNHLSSYAEKK